jgi:sec-independent protein translocase protein TatB
VFDIGVTKLAIIGGIALVVIGPERLPGLARTVGTLLGRAQRYVADVKAEVNRSMELDELRKMRDTVHTAAREVDQAVQTHVGEFEKAWVSEPTPADMPAVSGVVACDVPQYRHPGKQWRVRRAATPQWYKARANVRTKALSGAARVARHRPRTTR